MTRLGTETLRPSRAAHAEHLCTWEMKTGGLGIQGKLWVHR